MPAPTFYNFYPLLGFNPLQFTDKSSGDAIIAAYPSRFSYQLTHTDSGDVSHTVLNFINDTRAVESMYLTDWVVLEAVAPNTNPAKGVLAIWKNTAYATYFVVRS